jgi:hypothetical protein
VVDEQEWELGHGPERTARRLAGRIR